MTDLRAICDPELIGLDPAEVTGVEMIHEKHGNRLYRVRCGPRSFVLKWFGDSSRAIEVLSYTLLEEVGVPTLPVHGRTDSCLLLEDLESSPAWRLARANDVADARTGAAVAAWYLAFHAAGEKLLADPTTTPSFLGRELDTLDPGNIMAAGEALGLGSLPVWRLAAAHVEELAAAMRSLPETLNYNDFHWSNLALSRSREPFLRAVVFDFHLLGIGPRYADCRNVVGSLGERAEAAFWEAYGEVDEREKLLDDPMSVLIALVVALQRAEFPKWGQGLVDKARSGELERSLRRALEII